MSTEQVGLRDRRKPGHCWQDNELYDTFGPIIGPMAVLVYVQITRDCFGAALECKLRELAVAVGISKDTVRRALGVMELIGMLRAAERVPGRPVKYELTDLKELAIHLGASWDGRRSCWVLAAERVAKLKLDVDGFLKRLRAETVSRGDRAVSVGDSSLFLPVSQGDRSVSHSGESVSVEGQLTSYRKKTILKKEPSPTPSLQEGDGELRSSAEGESASRLRDAVSRLMAFTGLSGERRRKRLTDAVEHQLLFGAEPYGGPEVVVDAMNEAWREYQACRRDGLLRYDWSSFRFITDGHWLHPLPVDQAKLQQWRGAQVGMWSPR